MFREMRVKKRETTREAAEEMLKTASHGVLAVHGDGGYPYAVPVSFAYKDSKIYIHCARGGHKLDAVQNHEKVSFCVVAADHVVAERLTTRYASAVAFGTVRIVTDEAEAEAAARLLAHKYGCLDEAVIEKELAHYKGRYCILEIAVEHLTGKSALPSETAKSAH